MLKVDLVIFSFNSYFFLLICNTLKVIDFQLDLAYKMRMNKSYFLFLLVILCSFPLIQAQEGTKKVIDSLYLDLVIQKADTNRINTAIALVTELSLNGNHEKAIGIIQDNIGLSKKLNFDKGTASLLYVSGNCNADLENFHLALDDYNSSITYYEKIGNHTGVAYIKNNAGIIHRKLGNYSESIKHFLESIKYFEEIDFKVGASYGYASIGRTYNQVGELEQALKYTLKGYAVTKEIGDDLGVFHSAMFLAEIYVKIKDNQRALLYLKEAIQLARKENDKSFLGQVSERMGRLYIELGDFEKADNYLNQALGIFRRLKLPSSEISVLNGIAELHLKSEAFEEAEKVLTRANLMINDGTEKIIAIENYELMALLYDLSDDAKNALLWYKKKDSLKSMTFNEVEMEKIYQIQSQYELEKAEEVFQEEKAETDKEIQKQKTIIIVLIVLASAILIVAFFIYRSRKNKIAYTKLIDTQATELAESNKVKDRLFSIVAHDLKNSIFSISGVLNLLNDGALSSDEFNDLLPELTSNTNNTSLMLVNLLNWSKSQMKALDPKPISFNFKEIADEKENFFRSLATAKGVTLINETSDSNILADRDMVDIVVQNLMANAVKFCRKGDKVILSTKEENQNVTICIKDTGIGISKSNVNNLFKENSFTTIGTENEKGTGLGLVICKELVEINHGSIKVESTEGKGSTFCVTLPQK